MFSTSSTLYTARHSARCLAAVVGDSTRHRFLVGTCDVHEANSIDVLEFDDESNAIACIGRLTHAAETFALAPSPYDSRRVATAAPTTDGYEVVVWSCDFDSWGRSASMDEDDEDDEDTHHRDHGNKWRGAANDLVPEAPLGTEATLATTGYARSVVWCPKDHNGPNLLVTLDATTLRRWDVSKPAAPASTVRVDDKPSAAAWSPSGKEARVRRPTIHRHSADEVAVASRQGLTTYDSRMMTTALQIRSGDCAALALDYNPNKPFCVATAGDDGNVKFWDVRHSTRPLTVLKAHAHLATCVAYNRFHDQLVVSAGSDATLNLWRLSSISSAPLLEMEATPQDGDDDDSVDGEETHRSEHDGDVSRPSAADGEARSDPPDVLVRDFGDQHDEAITAVAWSACDAWTFCSLSYDGRVVLGHVPAPEKYKILL